MANVVGFFIAVLSAIANGTFTVPSKVEPAKSSGVDTNVFNVYVGLGVAVSAALVPLIFHLPVTFTWLGLIAGIFLSISTMHAFAAVKLLGVAVASGVWCGVAVVVAFLYGYIFDKPVSNLALAIVAIVLLVLSIAGIAYAQRASSDGDEAATLLDDSDEKGPFNLPASFIKGLGFALIAGAFGGLILAPENYAPESAAGLNFIFSFGIGVLISSPIVNLTPYIVKQKMPEFYLKEAGPLGFLGGVIWNIGNVCSMVAIKQIGYSIAYPMMQTGLFVSGLWGIFLFGEIRGPAQNYYWISGAILVAGALALNFSQ